MGIGLVFYFKKKDPRLGSLTCYSVTVATVCCWMMWACVWLSQWKPIIVANPKEEAA